MSKLRIIFVCIHNSARSQMAEELLKKLAGDRFETESAGINPGVLNPIVVEVLKEEDINIEGKATRSVFDLLGEGREYDYVVTVCDETSAEKCPILPGIAQRIHWGFTDPSQFQGSDVEKIEKTRDVKNEIKEKLQEWLLTLDERGVQ